MSQDGILRTRNSLVLAKIESTVGTDASPVAGSDAVLTTIPKISFNPNIINTDNVTGAMDGAGPIYTGMTCQVAFDVYFKGSGAAGTAPEMGKLLKGCSYEEVITASAVPASPAACGAGGSTTTAQLGVAASATAQAYRGMPINLTDEVAGTSFITDYTTGKIATLTDTFGAIDADTSYQIPVNVLYRPLSDNIPSLTMYVYRDGVLEKFVGCRGNVQFRLDVNGAPVASFTFMGVYAGKTDAAVPASPVFQATQPPPFQNGKLLMNRLPVAAAQLTLDSGIELAWPDDPNQVEGYRPVIPTFRRMNGSINPLETLVATRDLMSDFRNGTRRIIHARWGQTAGNRMGITIPQAQYLNHTPGDRNRLAQAEVPFEAVGANAGAFLCFY